MGTKGQMNIYQWIDFDPGCVNNSMNAPDINFLKMAAICRDSWIFNGWTVTPFSVKSLPRDKWWVPKGRFAEGVKEDGNKGAPLWMWQVYEALHDAAPCWFTEADVFCNYFRPNQPSQTTSCGPCWIQSCFYITRYGIAQIRNLIHRYETGEFPDVPTDWQGTEPFLAREFECHTLNYMGLPNKPHSRLIHYTRSAVAQMFK